MDDEKDEQVDDRSIETEYKGKDIWRREQREQGRMRKMKRRCREGT